MRVKNISCNFFNKDLNIEFNDSSNHESNTYSLILGNNGSGKSTLFEAILSYFSNEYNRRDIECNLNIEGKIRKIILSTYSPYDRIRTQISRRKKGGENEHNVDARAKVKEEAEIVYPHHSLNEVISLASSSYFKCKISNVGHFKKVEEEVSNLIGFDSNSVYLLIQSINQERISNLFEQSTINFDFSLCKLVEKRLNYSNSETRAIIESFETLFDKKNRIISNIMTEMTNDKYLSENDIIEYVENILLPIFQDLNFRKNYFVDHLLSNYDSYVYTKCNISESLYFEKRFAGVYENIKELMHLKEDFLFYINEFAHSFQIQFDSISKYFLKLDTKCSLKLFSILLILKKTYQNIQQQFGKQLSYEGERRVLEIDSILEYYSKVFWDSGTLLNLDFDILEKTGNFLIDDLIILKNSRPISITKLSSGELALFVRIMEISLYIENDTLILIDEPETHLNPYWINQYYYLLKECFANLNCHFIIASQSPIVVGMFNKEQVFFLKSEDGSISVKVFEEETFVNNIDSILSFVFDVTYFNNPLVKKESADIKELSERDLFGALDRINQIAYSSVRNQIISEVLTEEKITQFEKLINEVDK
jgi:hypothetical protein